MCWLGHRPFRGWGPPATYGIIQTTKLAQNLFALLKNASVLQAGRAALEDGWLRQ